MKKLIAIGVIMLVSIAYLCADPDQTPGTKSGPATKKPNAAKGKKEYVLMETTKGNIKIELYPDKAPITVKNFLDYVKSGHYDGTIFHRVIPGFVIQGGGFTKDMAQKPTRPPIKNESNNGLKNDRGTLSMARLPDVNSATSQFFINLKDNAALNYPTNGGYAVFAKVVDGMNVVDQIAGVKTTTKQGYENVPVEPVIISKASIVKE